MVHSNVASEIKKVLHTERVRMFRIHENEGKAAY